MKKADDYEQKYYDLLYENRKLKERVNELETIIKITKKNKYELTRYIYGEIRKQNAKNRKNNT